MQLTKSDQWYTDFLGTLAPPVPQPVRFPNGAAVYTAGPLDAYAWPGGYPIAYHPVDADGCTVGDVICAACANAEAAAGFDYANDVGFIASILEEVHSNEYCDNCSAVIAYQTWCDFCQDTVDCDEEHPIHVCKPLKWSFTAAYRREQTRPSMERYATREAAREHQRRYKRMGYWTSAVTPIVPPILPDAWA